MPEVAYALAGSLDLAQAEELSLLVDLEARWENLRKVNLGHNLQDLQARQKAYYAFHAKLVVYNRRYTPTHVPERLLNTPLRLALWCRRCASSTARWSTSPGATARSTCWRRPTAVPTTWPPDSTRTPRAAPQRCRSRATTRLGPWRGWLNGAMPWRPSPQSAELFLALASFFQYDPLLHLGEGNRE